jgi:hypothetical protein
MLQSALLRLYGAILKSSRVEVRDFTSMIVKLLTLLAFANPSHGLVLGIY